MRPNIPPKEFAEWLNRLPEEDRIHSNNEELNSAENDYKIFIAYFKDSKCSLCYKPLSSFNPDNPCLHWLLRPKMFKKKHFPLLYDKYTFFRMSAYVRWVASIDAPLRNINDLVDEHPGGKVIDFSAKYKHYMWSFSCGQSDLKGHAGKNYGYMPHYHMQMTLNSKSFINYNDFHIPFHSDDLYDLELFHNHSDIVCHDYGRGTGMQVLENPDTLERLVDIATPIHDPEEATLKFTTMIEGHDQLLSGELITEAIEEAKAKNKTLTSVLRDKLKNTSASITTMVFPGDGVPKPQQRSDRHHKNN